MTILSETGRMDIIDHLVEKYRQFGREFDGRTVYSVPFALCDLELSITDDGSEDPTVVFAENFSGPDLENVLGCAGSRYVFIGGHEGIREVQVWSMQRPSRETPVPNVDSNSVRSRVLGNVTAADEDLFDRYLTYAELAHVPCID